MGRSPSRNRIWCILALKCDICWLKFSQFSWQRTRESLPFAQFTKCSEHFVNCAKVGTAQSWQPSSNQLQFVVRFLKKSGIKTMRSCAENAWDNFCAGGNAWVDQNAWDSACLLKNRPHRHYCSKQQEAGETVNEVTRQSQSISSTPCLSSFDQIAGNSDM